MSTITDPNERLVAFYEAQYAPKHPTQRTTVPSKSIYANLDGVRYLVARRCMHCAQMKSVAELVRDCTQSDGVGYRCLDCISSKKKARVVTMTGTFTGTLERVS